MTLKMRISIVYASHPTLLWVLSEESTDWCHREPRNKK